MGQYRAKKRLGQNFLKSPDIIRKIVELVDPCPDDDIIEVGPGRGALTLALAQSGSRIVAVEFDRDLIGHLTKITREYDNVELIHRDFLTYEPDAASFKLVGNLPFNITAPVIEWTQKYAKSVNRACLMVQKEVALRLTSSPNSKDWSPMAIFTQLSFDITSCFDVAPKHFTPPPKVTSTVIELRPKLEPTIPHLPAFEKLVRMSFRQRRKTLLNNLISELSVEREKMLSALTEAGLGERSRAEQVSTRQFLELTNYLVNHNILSA